MENIFYKPTYILQQKTLQFHLGNIQLFFRTFFPIDKKLKPSIKEVYLLNKRFDELLKKDLANVEKGFYSKELLFQIPFDSYLKNLPDLFSEVISMYLRQKNNKWNELPENIDKKAYPNYFLRNFHWQTDGYFSKKSAERYELGVEFLFVGIADVMRRQVIPPISKFIKNKKDIKLIDIACGNGSSFKQILKTYPEINITGLDLSEAYINFAKEKYKNLKNINLVTENAENTSFDNNSFDIVTSTYLFHELPYQVRKKVISEMKRIVKNDGIIVIQDSIQLSDSPDLEVTLNRFAKEFHEPFYKNYIENDLATIFEEEGLKLVNTDISYASKTLVFKKN